MQPPSEQSGDLRNELRDDAQKLTSSATERLHSEAEQRKGPAVEQARSVASALDRAAQDLGGGKSPAWLKSLFEQGAAQIQQLADAVEQKDSRELVEDIRQIARNNPTTFLATCAAAGFAASRIFRAEPSTLPATASTPVSGGNFQPSSNQWSPATSGFGGVS
jgi:ElaB/YqjD/DUF883 family membrane-anchored ribosome-binding protein